MKIKLPGWTIAGNSLLYGENEAGTLLEDLFSFQIVNPEVDFEFSKDLEDIPVIQCDIDSFIEGQLQGWFE